MEFQYHLLKDLFGLSRAVCAIARFNLGANSEEIRNEVNIAKVCAHLICHLTCL